MGGKDRILTFANRVRDAASSSLPAIADQTQRSPSTTTSRTKHPVLASGGPNIMAEGTYPRACLLQDGSLLGVHTFFQGGANVIAITRGSDHGQKWSRVGEVTRGVGDIDNPFIVQLPLNGRILCAFRNHDRTPEGSYTHFRITVCYSDDGGVSWQYLSTAAENSNAATGFRGLWEPFMRIARDGSLQLYYSRELSAEDQDSILRISYDGGGTWGPERTISGEGIVSRDGMLGLAMLGWGLIAVFETTEDGPMAIKLVESFDDGATWGNRQLVYRASGGGIAAAPQVTNCGGVLVITFQTDEDGGGGLSIKMLVGVPGRWENKMVVAPAHSQWGGVTTLDESSVLVLFDHGGVKTRTVSLSG